MLAAASVAAAGPKRPALTVVISIDQFRADYIERLSEFFQPAGTDANPGGFEYLRAKGADYYDCQYAHFPTYTGVGHATILTGASPLTHGIVGNNWWSKAQAKGVYCVDDDRWQVVGAGPDSKAKPMGPGNLRATTVGDELLLATN